MNSSFSHEEHRYAIQKPEGFVVMEYRSGFLAGTVPAQIHKLQKDVPYSTPLPAGHPWAEALEDFALLRRTHPTSVELQISDGFSPSRFHPTGSDSRKSDEFRSSRLHLIGGSVLLYRSHSLLSGVATIHPGRLAGILSLLPVIRFG